MFCAGRGCEWFTFHPFISSPVTDLFVTQLQISGARNLIYFLLEEQAPLSSLAVEIKNPFFLNQFVSCLYFFFLRSFSSFQSFPLQTFCFPAPVWRMYPSCGFSHPAKAPSLTWNSCHFSACFILPESYFSSPVFLSRSHPGIISIFLTKRAKLDMLNEFVSLVISSNEQHRKLMEKTCLIRKATSCCSDWNSHFQQTQNGSEVKTGEVSRVITKLRSTKSALKHIYSTI